MCRIFLARLTDISLQNINLNKLVQYFADLSEIGHLPCGIMGGHKDGFGFAFVNKSGKEIIKSPRPILEDKEVYDQVQNRLNLISGGDIILGHLRAATHGDQAIVNTHPFERENLIMVHNGSIDKRLDEPFPHLKCRCDGDTDTERMLQQAEEYVEEGLSVRDAYLKMLNEIIDKYPNYRSAISIMIHSSKNGDLPAVYATRLFNRNLKEVGVDNYYTLYRGVDDFGGEYICSEPLPEPGISWRVLSNGEVLEMSNGQTSIEKVFNK